MAKRKEISSTLYHRFGSTSWSKNNFHSVSFQLLESSSEYFHSIHRSNRFEMEPLYRKKSFLTLLVRLTLKISILLPSNTRFLLVQRIFSHTNFGWLQYSSFSICIILARNPRENRRSRSRNEDWFFAAWIAHGEFSNQIKLYEFNQEFFERYAQSTAPNVIVILLLAEGSRDACVKRFRKEIDALRTHARLIFSIYSREKASAWIEQLEEQSARKLPSATVLALYLRRRFFVSFPFEESSSSTLTFSDWIDLLLEGNFREPVPVADWPRDFV